MRSVMAVAVGVMVAAAGCSSANTGKAGVVYPLPSDGWQPGQPEYHVLGSGTFEAVLTRQGACAWLGPAKYVILWPEGYGVRFHPTELIGPTGKVLAKAGEYVAFPAGPLLPGGLPNRCPMLHGGEIPVSGGAQEPPPVGGT